MKREYKTITPDMIRKYFGQNARITRRIAGGWLVRTAKGGEIKISQSNIDPVYGGSAVYRAAVLLAEEAWGGGSVNGPPEFMLAMLAHGEAEGVNMRVKERGQVARLVFASLVAWIGIAFSGPGPWPFVWLFVGVVLWLLLRGGAKRRAQRETDQLGYNFPRSADAREASDEDLRQGDWL